MLTLLSISTLALTSVASLDDEIVVNAALTQFFKKGAWNSEYWSKGDFVVLASEYSGHGRPDFFDSLKRGIINHGSEHGSKVILERLKRISRLSDQGKKALPPGDPVPISQMFLDKRIIVQADPFGCKDRSNGRLPWRLRERGASSVADNIRAAGHISAPCYSSNGRFAYTSFSMPFGMHSAEASFYLEWIKGRWTVILAEAVYYL